MNIDIPDFLLEMSKQISTQDNRITADPIWMVCYDKAHITAEDYEDYHVWADHNHDYDEFVNSNTTSDEQADICKYLCENHTDWSKKFIDADGSGEDGLYEEMYETFDADLYGMPPGVEKHHMVKRMEVVKACLTEADANWFIQRKQHDYPKLYTYVFSMCYCPQMIELRDWIKSLTTKEEK